METIRVLIADDHPLVRCGIRETLRAAADMVLLGEASRGDETQRLCRELQPDVLLLDLQMPGATASETVAYIREQCPQTGIIILTAYDDEVYVRRMLAAGAMGYVLKDEVADVIITAIQTVLQGGVWLSRRVSDTLMGEWPSHPQGIPPHVTERERSVLRLVAQGLPEKEIAHAEGRSLRTIQRIVTILETKLEAPNLAVLILKASRLGLLDE